MISAPFHLTYPIAPAPGCPLCQSPIDSHIVWRNDLLRIVQVDDVGFPGFCRVIWHSHVREMSDLSAHHQQHLMNTIFSTERVLRGLLQPDKINLASLGNQVPHLHWHIIPRFEWDSHFPDSIWSTAKRAVNSAQCQLLRQRLSSFATALTSVLGPSGDHHHKHIHDPHQ